MPDEMNQSDADLFLVHELERLGCRCASVQTDDSHVNDDGTAAVAVSGPHLPDCPAIAHYSDPANWPEELRDLD